MLLFQYISFTFVYVLRILFLFVEKDFTAAGKDKDDQGILSVKKKGGDNSTKKKNDNFEAETTKSTAQSLEENRNSLSQLQNEMNKNSEELQRGVGWKKDCTGISK